MVPFLAGVPSSSSLAVAWATSPATFVLTSLLTLLATLVFLRLIANTFTGRAPPVTEGIPLIGGLLKFSRGPWELMNEIYTKHGEVVTVPLLHKKMTFLFGPSGASFVSRLSSLVYICLSDRGGRCAPSALSVSLAFSPALAVSPHFFNANDDKMSQTEVYDFNVPTFGKGVVYDVDVKVRSEQFRIVGEALRSAKLKEYVPQFVEESKLYFDKWGETGVVNLPDVFGELIILTASRTLLGKEVREHMFGEVADLYHDLDDGMRPISVLFPYLPTPYHRRRDAARAKMAEIFGKIIAGRRASGTSEPDMLQVLIDAKYQKVNGGRLLNDEEIVGLLIAVLFAGQHTSTITSSWTGLQMISHPDTWNAAVEEQKKVIKEQGKDITFDMLTGLDVLHRNIHEALRLGPPLIMVMRYAKEEFTVTTSKGKEFVIPKGHIVAASPTFSHRLKDVFQNPDAYEPDRFAAPRSEDKAKPFSYLGFGGGRHACMGQQFAMLQIKTIWSILLREFDMEMLDEFPEPDFTSMVIGPKPCRVRYTRKTKL